MCVCVCMCVYVCMRVCVCVCYSDHKVNDSKKSVHNHTHPISKPQTLLFTSESHVVQQELSNTYSTETHFALSPQHGMVCCINDNVVMSGNINNNNGNVQRGSGKDAVSVRPDTAFTQ